MEGFFDCLPVSERLQWNLRPLGKQRQDRGGGSKNTTQQYPSIDGGLSKRDYRTGNQRVLYRAL